MKNDKDLKRITQDKLDRLITSGEKDFSFLDLTRLDLSFSHLSDADFTGSNLSNSNFSDAILDHAILKNCRANYTNFEGCSLSHANLNGGNLQFANFHDVNLCHASLKESLLSEANLSNALLVGADFEGAYLGGTIFSNSNLICSNTKYVNTDFATACFLPLCPSHGSFIGWMKAENECIVKLLVPEDALRSSSTTRECRCSKAIVLDIQDLKGNSFDKDVEVRSSCKNFKYKVGNTYTVDNFDRENWREKSNGINFFITRDEATRVWLHM